MGYKEWSFRIGSFLFHNREQFDLGIWPLFCIHKYSKNNNVCTRVFYIKRLYDW